MSDPLEHLARRVADHPFFLAAPLDRYARSAGLDDAALAARLQCPVAMLTRVRLCRNPSPEAPMFWQDVETIAARFSLNAESLAEMVRFGQNLLRLEGPAEGRAPDQPGFLLAARDGDETPPPAPEAAP